MLSTERKQLLLDELNSHGRILTSDIAARLGVSDVTVRTDLDELERRGRLVRTHGGAVPVGQGVNGSVLGFDARMAMNREAKRRIAIAAASYISSHQTIILDGGTTTYHLATAIPDVTDLTVYTPGITIAQHLLTVEGVEPHLMGGRVDPTWLETVGTTREQGIEDLIAHTLFLGAHAVDKDLDIVDDSRTLARNKQQFARRARTTVLMVDSTKWENAGGAAKVMSVSDVDVVITDRGIDKRTTEKLKALKVQLVVV